MQEEDFEPQEPWSPHPAPFAKHLSWIEEFSRQSNLVAFRFLGPVFSGSVGEREYLGRELLS